jgi:hypothetical protein
MNLLETDLIRAMGVAMETANKRKYEIIFWIQVLQISLSKKHQMLVTQLEDQEQETKNRI